MVGKHRLFNELTKYPAEKLAAVAFSALILSCNAPMPHGKSPTTNSLKSAWSGGTCELNGNSVKYDCGRESNSLLLDVSVSEPRAIRCSPSFTAIIERNDVVVTLGADGVLSGREYLGVIGQRLIFANSYSVSIKAQSSEGILSDRLAGNELWIETAAGKRWILDMSDPWGPWQSLNSR